MKDDWKRIEYGALIYLSSDRVYRRGSLQRGTRNGVNIKSDRKSNELFVGIVHNHPIGDGSAPSNDKDWPSADSLVNSGKANPNNFAIYILDGNSKELNEFDYLEDRDLESANEKTKNDANGNNCNDV